MLYFQWVPGYFKATILLNMEKSNFKKMTTEGLKRARESLNKLRQPAKPTEEQVRIVEEAMIINEKINEKIDEAEKDKVAARPAADVNP